MSTRGLGIRVAGDRELPRLRRRMYVRRIEPSLFRLVVYILAPAYGNRAPIFVDKPRRRIGA